MLVSTSICLGLSRVPLGQCVGKYFNMARSESCPPLGQCVGKYFNMSRSESCPP